MADNNLSNTSTLATDQAPSMQALILKARAVYADSPNADPQALAEQVAQEIEALLISWGISPEVAQQAAGVALTTLGQASTSQGGDFASLSTALNGLLAGPLAPLIAPVPATTGERVPTSPGTNARTASDAATEPASAPPARGNIETADAPASSLEPSTTGPTVAAQPLIPTALVSNPNPSTAAFGNMARPEITGITPNSLDTNPAPRVTPPESTAITNAPGSAARNSSPEVTQLTDVAPPAAATPSIPTIARPQDLPAPAAPLIQGVKTDTGVSATDAITGITQPQVQGLADPNTQIQVFLGQTLVGTAQTASNGTWSVPITVQLNDGTHLLRANAINATGKVSAPSQEFTLTIDTQVAAPAIRGLSADTGVSSSDGITNDTTLILQGTAEAGSQVELFHNGTTIGTAQTDSTGRWSFDYSQTSLTAGEHGFTAQATDIAGNRSAASPAYVVTVDLQVEAPVITGITSDTGVRNDDRLTHDSGLVLEGQAEANSQVEVFRGGQSIGTTQADSTGRWTFDYSNSALAEGPHSFTAQATDVAGNRSAPSADFVVTLDTSVAAPVINAISTDTGSSNNDGVTSDTSLILNGSAEAHSQVELFHNGATIGTAQADGEGRWSFDYSQTSLTAGNHGFTAQATDPAGNLSAMSQTYGVTVDTHIDAPAITGFSNDTGMSALDRLTNDTTLVLSGTAEAGSQVQLSHNGTAIGTAQADGNGRWSFDYGQTNLTAGDHRFTAHATDVAGNQSAASPAYMISIDTQVEAPVIAGITTDTGVRNDDRLTHDTGLTLEGQAEANSQVEVFHGGQSIGTTQADGTGHWSFDYSNTVLAEGSHSFTAQATDVAGNRSLASTEFLVTVDTQVAAPSITAISTDSGTSSSDQVTNDTTLVLSGTAEANSVVELFRDGQTIGTASSDSQGAWTFDYGATTLPDGTHNFTARATDAAGNTSAYSSVFPVKVDTGIDQNAWSIRLDAASDLGISDSDSFTSDTTPTFVGTAEANASVALYIDRNSDGTLADDERIGSGVADADGRWSITSSALPDGLAAVVAKVSDAAGNEWAAAGRTNVFIATRPPEPASAPDLIASDDSGTSRTDNITASTSQTFMGTGIKGYAITLFNDANGNGSFDPEEAIGSATVDAQGFWRITATLDEGSFNLRTVQTDPAGNQSNASDPLIVTVDRSIAAPGPIDLAASSDSGVSTADQITNQSSLSLSGEGEAHSTLTLFDDRDQDGQLDAGETLTQVQVGADGQWTTSTGALADGEYNLRALQQDRAGNLSGASEATLIKVDTVALAPSTPALATTSDTGFSSHDGVTQAANPTLVGTGEAGALVSVFQDSNENGVLDDGESLGSAAVADNGTWSLMVGTNLTEGVHIVRATQTDIAGNQSNLSGSLVLNIDTQTHGSVDAVADDTGASSNDFLTRDNGLVFRGTAEAGALVEVFLGTESIGSVFADKGGNWSLDRTGSALDDGEYSLTARITDTAGNSVTTAARTLRIDTNVGLEEDLSKLALINSSDTGSSNSDGLTADTSPTIEFTSLADNDLQVDWGDGRGFQPIGTGTGSVQQITLDQAYGSDGLKIIQVRATDLAGNESIQTLQIVIDTQSQVSLQGFLQDSGRSDNDGLTNDASPTLFGYAEGGATLTLFNDINANGLLDGGEAIGGIALDGAGADRVGFQVSPSTALPDGQYNLRVQSTDLAGNSQVSGPLNLTLDTQAAAPLAVELATISDSGASTSDGLTRAKTLSLSGTGAEAQARVSLFNDANHNGLLDQGELLGTALADSQGSWHTELLGLHEGNYQVKAIQTDLAGNTSAASSALDLTVDRTAPAMPGTLDLSAGSDTGLSNSDNLTSMATPTLAGLGESNATIRLFNDANLNGEVDANELLGTTTADGSGAWSLTVTNPLADGTYYLRATQTDLAGNLSEASAALAITVDTRVQVSGLDLTDQSDSGNYTASQILVGYSKYDGTGSHTFIRNLDNGSELQLDIDAQGDQSDWSYLSWGYGGNSGFSSDGRYVVFMAQGLGEDNYQTQLYVRDLSTDTLIPVSMNATGEMANNYSEQGVISATGRYVAFSSYADNLVEGDTNNLYDVFVRDLQTGSITRVSTRNDGSQMSHPEGDDYYYYSGSYAVDLTADGQQVLFNADPRYLVDGIEYNTDNSYYYHFQEPLLKDLGTGTLTRVGLREDGTSPYDNGDGLYHYSYTYATDLTADGRYVLLYSSDREFILEGTNGQAHVFVRDLQTGDVTIASTASDGTQANNYSNPTALSNDGRYVLFQSSATNLGFSNATNDYGSDLYLKDLQTGELRRLGDSSYSYVDSQYTNTWFQSATFVYNADGGVDSVVFLEKHQEGVYSPTYSYTYVDTLVTYNLATDSATRLEVTRYDSSQTDNYHHYHGDGQVVYIPGSGDQSTAVDNLTQDTSPTIALVADAGSQVDIDWGDGRGYQAAGTATGGRQQFTLDQAYEGDGARTITARVTDTAGNSSQTALTLTIDTTVTAPTLAVSSESDSGRSNHDGVTQHRTPTLSGLAEAGATVELVRDLDGNGQINDGERIATLQADSVTGAWNYTPTVPWAEGDYILQARQTDAAGNTSDLTAPVRVVIDSTVPNMPQILTVRNAANDVIDNGSTTSDTTLTVQGSAEAHSLVSVLDGETLLGTTTTDGFGFWSFTTGALARDQNHAFTARATDIAGNSSMTSTSYGVTVETSVLTEGNALVLANGTDFGTQVLSGVDDGSIPIDVSAVFAGGINLLGVSYTQVYMSSNGYISFGTDGGYGATLSSHTGAPLFAAQPEDLVLYGSTTQSPGGNSTGSHNAYYHVDATNGIVTFTWDDVSPYGGYVSAGDNTVGNAFQVRLHRMDDGGFTAEFRYENISWVKNTTSNAGWSAGDGLHYGQVVDPARNDILEVESTSNINQPGVWAWSFSADGAPITEESVVDLRDVASMAEHEQIFNFETGSGGDLLLLSATDTSSSSGTTLGVDQAVAGIGEGTYDLMGISADSVDVVVLNDGQSLTLGLDGGADLNHAGDGSALLTALTDSMLAGDSYTGINVNAGTRVFLLAYQSNPLDGAQTNAYLYHGQDADLGGSLTADEIRLVASLESVDGTNSLTEHNINVA